MEKMTFSEIKEQYTKEYNENLKKTGVFFAFSNQQFDENKTHKDAPDNEYKAVGLGGYIHKSNISKLENFFNEIEPKLKKKFIKKVNINDMIDYELINHECWYTGDYMEIVPLIQSYYSDITVNEIIEKVKKVYESHPERLD